VVRPEARAHLWLEDDGQALLCCTQVEEKDRGENWFDQMTSIFLWRHQFDEAAKQAASVQAACNPTYTQDDVWRTMFNCVVDLVPRKGLLGRKEIVRALGPEFFKNHPRFQFRTDECCRFVN
jgi:hypothetical protein